MTNLTQQNLRPHLSPREHEIMEALMVDGASNQEIARRLGISKCTVRLHVRSILLRLGARNRTHAVILWSLHR